VRVCRRDQVGAGIGDRGIPRLREQTDARTREQGREQIGQLMGLRMLIQDCDFDLRTRPHHANRLRKRPCALRVLGDESIETTHESQCGIR